ncbi:DUF948 domain-containing protein [Sporosarcina sp. Marseille-Q4943]|uniref:DUF948 domain-containing protein n=1 Tax=Sporosarcina sp. Marseille-Q4943 TaxID=2942204 RepID=UPI00208DABED|nr:DUF948 domain-containing protein [Sporosarcina sp. Marseille-Q4943]
MLVPIGVFMMAIAFAIFAVALSKLLLRASSNIEVVRTAAVQMESKLDGTIQALEGTLDETNRTIADMEEKTTSLDSVFLSAEELGKGANALSEELESLTQGYASNGDAPGAKPFVRIIQTTEFVKGLFNSWKRGKALSDN